MLTVQCKPKLTHCPAGTHSWHSVSEMRGDSGVCVCALGPAPVLILKGHPVCLLCSLYSAVLDC